MSESLHQLQRETLRVYLFQSAPSDYLDMNRSGKSGQKFFMKVTRKAKIERWSTQAEPPKKPSRKTRDAFAGLPFLNRFSIVFVTDLM
jgi:hypothetical protein